MNSPYTIFDWLLAISLRASLLTLAVILIQSMLRRHLSPRWRYALWLPVLIVLLMPALVESRWSAESLLVVAAEPTQQVLPEVPVVFAPTGPAPVPAPPEPMIQLGWQHVWLIGALGLVITGLTSFMLTLRRFRKHARVADAELLAEVAALAEEIGLRRVPRVCLSSAISSPAVAGLFRPILLLPAGFREAFTAREARLVLKHELMHLKRGDLLMNALLCVLMALHWFNPLLWLAFYKARIDREAACDQDVLRHDSSAERVTYGHALLKAESAFCPRGWSLGFVGIFDRGAGMRARIRAIAEARHTPGSTAVITLGIMLVMIFLGTTRAQVAGEKQAKEEFVSLEIMIADLSGKAGDFSEPIQKMLASTHYSQVLSAADEKELRRQVIRSRDSKIISYPRVLTRLGQEASIRSVVNQPVPDEKQKSGISNLPIGLSFNLLPSRSGDKMRLKYDLTDSRMIGEEQTPKGPMPIVKSYRNESSVELEEGHTLALWNQEERRLYTVRQALVSGSEKLAANSPTPTDVAEAKAIELRRANPKQYDFNKAILGDVIRYLASDAGIRFVSLPDDQPVSRKAITFSLRSSPFEVLETICRAHGLALHLDQDVWHIWLASEKEAGVPLNKPELGSEFTIGQSAFRPGDSIRITQLQRGGDFMTVTADYELASADEARISLFITSKDKGRTRIVPSQTRDIVKGKGSVVLNLPDMPEGMPHVSFYSIADGKAFGGIYFGTREEAQASKMMRLGYLQSAKSGAPAQQSPLHSKLQSIILPQVQFSGATLEEAVEFFRVKSRALDASEPEVSKRGVNFILQDGSATEANISMDLKDVPLINVVKYTADLAGMEYRIEENVVVFLRGSKDSAAKPPAPINGKAVELAKKYKLPQVHYSKATLEEAVEFVRIKVQGREDDSSKLNFILKPGGNPKTQITLNLKDVSTWEALRYIAELSNHTLSADDHSIILTPR